MKRLYDLIHVFPVDYRTLRKAAKDAGIELRYVGRSGPWIRSEDFDRLKRNGFKYYKDKMTTKGIQ